MKTPRVLVYYGKCRAGYPYLRSNTKPSGNSLRKKRFARSEFTPERKDITGQKQLAYFSAKQQRTLFAGGIEEEFFHIIVSVPHCWGPGLGCSPNKVMKKDWNPQIREKNPIDVT